MENRTESGDTWLLEEGVSALKSSMGDPDLKHHWKSGGSSADGILRLFIGGRWLEFCVEIKDTLTEANISWLAARRTDSCPPLVVTRVVYPKLASRLKSLGLFYLDAAGNAWIRQGDFHIEIAGKRLRIPAERKPLSRAFKPSGLKIIFVLLAGAKADEMTYRELSKAAGVSLGSVGGILKELKSLGFWLDRPIERWGISRKQALFERWVTAYPEQLRKKLLLGRYGAVSEWRLRPDLQSVGGALWSGEPAAAELTKYLRPGSATVYLGSRDLNTFLHQNRLRKDPEGNIEILTRFWSQGAVQGLPNHPDLVHPIMIYADLLTIGDPRSIEAAKLVHDQYISPMFDNE